MMPNNTAMTSLETFIERLRRCLRCHVLASRSPQAFAQDIHGLRPAQSLQASRSAWPLSFSSPALSFQCRCHCCNARTARSGATQQALQLSQSGTKNAQNSVQYIGILLDEKSRGQQGPNSSNDYGAAPVGQVFCMMDLTSPAIRQQCPCSHLPTIHVWKVGRTCHVAPRRVFYK